MTVATIRHNSTFINNNVSGDASGGNMNSRTGTGDILHTQIQQGGGGHGLTTHNHAQTTSGIWDLANSTDMSYELAAAGTGNAPRAKLSTKSLSMVKELQKLPL